MTGLRGGVVSLGGQEGSEGSGESLTGLLGGGAGSFGGQGGSDVSFLVGKLYSCGGGAGRALEKRDRPFSRVAMAS